MLFQKYQHLESAGVSSQVTRVGRTKLVRIEIYTRHVRPAPPMAYRIGLNQKNYTRCARPAPGPIVQDGRYHGDTDASETICPTPWDLSNPPPRARRHCKPRGRARSIGFVPLVQPSWWITYHDQTRVRTPLGGRSRVCDMICAPVVWRGGREEEDLTGNGELAWGVSLWQSNEGGQQHRLGS
jgi:hypothetical protein